MEIVVKIKDEITKAKLKQIRQSDIHLTNLIVGFINNFDIQEHKQQIEALQKLYTSAAK